MSRVVTRLVSQDRVRSVAIPLLARFNPGDITIKHHWTGDPLRLHSFHHKGYWFHGRSREAETLDMFRRLLNPGDRVVEVGAHIGYFTILFSRLVGPGGQVTVFEPGENNLTYLRENTRGLSNVTIREAAVGRTVGVADFYVESISGQNNSLIEGYAGLESTAAAAHLDPGVRVVQVPVTTLEAIADELGDVDLVKIDIEGAELDALRGSAGWIATQRPMLMVEVTLRNTEVADLLRSLGYLLLSPEGALIESEPPSGNVFALHEDDHARALKGLLG